MMKIRTLSRAGIFYHFPSIIDMEEAFNHIVKNAHNDHTEVLTMYKKKQIDFNTMLQILIYDELRTQNAALRKLALNA